MKRESVALLLHPYRNALMPREELKGGLDRFAADFIAVGDEYPNIRWNLVLSGSFLEMIDPLLMQKLRELHKRGNLEWLTTGYTEPFLSLSPPTMTHENIQLGVETFSQLTGAKPAGYVPPFSNWEPSYIERLRETGLNYVVLSQALFPTETRGFRGTWVTEHAGTSIQLFPAHFFTSGTAPENVIDWLDHAFERASVPGENTQLMCIDFLVPLAASEQKPCDWVRSGAQQIEKHLLNYQCIRLGEALGPSYLWGLQYVPPGLVYRREDTESAPYFLNYLHTFDQVGIMQRKLMDLWERVCALPGKTDTLVRQLFAIQDVNRLLPGKQSGFSDHLDRLWTYERMIELEEELFSREGKKGGQIRVVDFLKTGAKSLILSNKALKVYIDQKNGGHIFELDHVPSKTNLCAGYSTIRHGLPAMFVPGKSKTAFVDHVLPAGCSYDDFVSDPAAEIGNFTSGSYDYKLRKIGASTKVSLTRTGSILQSEKSFPLTMEKVFGLEGDRAELSFVYQLFSHSLVAFVFKVAIEITILLPGAPLGKARLVLGRSAKRLPQSGPLVLEQATTFSVDDQSRGIRLRFVTQKPVDVWCYPAVPSSDGALGYQGTTLVLSTLVKLEEGATWSLIGKCECRKLLKRDGCDRKLWI